MKLSIKKNEIIEEFFNDKLLIGVRYPAHYSDFITHLYHFLALRFENTLSPITKEKEGSITSSGLFGDIATETPADFQVWQARDDMAKTGYLLYQNRIQTEYLVSHPQKLDLILLISNLSTTQKEPLLQTLNQIPQVQASMYLDLKTLKDASYLIR